MHRLALNRALIVLLFLIITATTVEAQASQSSGTVLAGDLLERIARGDGVNYDNATIIGDLDLGKLNLPKDEYGRAIVASKIQITNSRLDGNLNFSSTKFNNHVIFHGTVFLKNASFSYSQFWSQADFNGSEFSGKANFVMADFRDWLDLSNAVFSKGASFEDSIFNAECSLSFTTFREEALFEDAVFNRYISLKEAQFYGLASFYRAEFSQEVHFDGAKFSRYANFNESRFRDYAYFTGTEFQGPVSLNKTEIADWMIDWDSINRRLRFNDPAYQALLQKFWSSGDFSDYDDCYYQYRSQRQMLEPIGTTKAIDLLAWAMCGYGVRPLHTMAFGLIVIAFFGIIYWKANVVQRLLYVKRADSHRRDEENISTLEESMYFSMMMFLTRPSYGLHPSGRLKYLIIIEYISGWLIMALFLVILARMMLR